MTLRPSKRPELGAPWKLGRSVDFILTVVGSCPACVKPGSSLIIFAYCAILGVELKGQKRGLGCHVNTYYFGAFHESPSQLGETYKMQRQALLSIRKSEEANFLSEVP